MTDAALIERPRRRDAAATQAAILAAGEAHFARAGYEGALLRDIAADAGVDAALINRYFGGKEGLFRAVLTGAIRSERLFEGDRASFGRHAAKVFANAAAPQSEHGLTRFQLILHAATSPTAQPLLNAAVQARFMGPIREWLGGADAAPRARLISALFIGCLVEARVRGAALSAEERGPFIERLAAMFQSLIDG